MLNDELKDEDLDGLLYHFEQIILEGAVENINTLEEYMNSNYDSALLIGDSKQDDPDLMDALRLTMRLCVKYYMDREDYLKVQKLHDLNNIINKLKPKIVDGTIVDQARFNNN